MRVRLEYLNLLGVALLAALCAVQWSANRRVHLEVHRLEKLRNEQSQRIDEQANSLAGSRADLDAFRDQLEKTAGLLKKGEANKHAAESEAAKLMAERDQLKDSVLKWSEAVAARDLHLEQAREQLQTLATDRNAAVTKFNTLAEKYNALAAELDTRTRALNSLTEKFNALVEAKAGASK